MVSVQNTQPQLCVIEIGEGSDRPTRISTPVQALLPGSGSYPKGTLVRFQTVFSPPDHGPNKSGTVRLAYLKYDYEQADQHLRCLPSESMLKEVEKRVGRYTIHIGGSGILDPRSIPATELADHLDHHIRPSLTELIQTSLVILKERQECLEKTRSTVEWGHCQDQLSVHSDSLSQSISQLTDRKQIIILFSPNLYTTRSIITMTNRFYSRQQDFCIDRVVLVDRAPRDASVLNLSREYGLLTCVSDQWRAADRQSEHLLLAGCGPYVNIRNRDHDAHGGNLFAVENAKDTEEDQLLTIVLESDGPGVLGVQTTRFDLRQDGDYSVGEELDPTCRPSILLTHWRTRSTEAQNLLGPFLGRLDHDVVPHPHPDSRKYCQRVIFDSLTPTQLDGIIRCLNQPLLNQLFHAGDYDALLQEADSSKVRTLVCKAGHLPPIEALLRVDENMQTRPIVHGLVRLYTELTTEELVTELRKQNDACLKGTGKEWRAGALSPYQAILDDRGTHWICEVATPPPRRGTFRGWGSPTITVSPKMDLLVLKGPVPSWPRDNIRKVLGDLGVEDNEISQARWATLDDGSHRIVLPKTKANQSVGGYKYYKGFVLVELGELPIGMTYSKGKLVFRTCQVGKNPITTSMQELDEAALKGKAGRHYPGVTEQAFLDKLESTPHKANAHKHDPRQSPAHPPHNSTHKHGTNAPHNNDLSTREANTTSNTTRAPPTNGQNIAHTRPDPAPAQRAHTPAQRRAHNPHSVTRADITRAAMPPPPLLTNTTTSNRGKEMPSRLSKGAPGRTNDGPRLLSPR